MTKADLIDLIAERAKLPHGRAELLICQMFDSMVDALCRGEGIEIRGFGSFSIRAYKEYQGRNPRTGEAVRVRPKRLAFFKVGKELRERVNISRGTNGSGNGVGHIDLDDDDADDDAELDSDAE
ncbi:MAG TPA: HU family DNA-binding protein [Polyangia bacterium]|nr:HU family DNA-binding protein [Polyangia bacterium]